MNPPALSPAARLVLLAIDESTTVDQVAAILVREKVAAAGRKATARAVSVLDHLHSVGAVVVHLDETWTVTPRGDRFRDWLLRELAEGGKRPAKASDAPKPRPSRSKSPERASAPNPATTEASSDDRITFTTPNGWVVHLSPFRQKRARGDK